MSTRNYWPGTTNKYHAKKTLSELCGRVFDSMAEARRGEELRLLELAGEIKRLTYQVRYILCDKPRVTIKIDFRYEENGEAVYEDTKGVMTRDFRTKLAWLKEKHGIKVRINGNEVSQ